MKKILSLALVLAMVLTMSATAFAAEIKQDTENKTGSTDITHTVSDSYIVTIPDSMTVGTDATVSASDVRLAKYFELAVSVSSTQYNDGWKLKNGDDTIGYTLKIDNADVANNGRVLTAKSGETATETLVTAVSENQKPKYSGSYTDRLTFSVSIAAAPIDATAMTADALKTAVAAQLTAGETEIEITLPANAGGTMFTAIRCALIDTEGVADGSINLTLKGVTTIPEHSESWYDSNNVIFGKMTKDENGDYLEELEFVTQLKSVNLPDVLTIGSRAFADCKNLAVLTAPKVQTIGSWAFASTGLTTVDLPEATTVDFGAFMDCSNLTSVKLPKATNIGDQAFLVSSNITTLELTAKGSITVGDSVFSVPSQNFSHNVALTLNSDKQSEVTNGNTWQGYTFKSITFVD